MLLQRIRGLWNTYHGILAIILTLVFWSYLLALAVLFKDIETKNFILYNLAGIVGLIIAAIRGRSAAATLLAGALSSVTPWRSSKQSMSV
jgi:succinate-acetate transporter protein